MKKLALFMTFLSLSLDVLATDCMVREVSKTGKVLVLPHYEASVNYFFDKVTKSAFATVSWYINEDHTRNCFNITKERYSSREVVIPRSKASHLTIRVHGNPEAVELNFHTQANGHFFANTRTIEIPYSIRKELEETLKKGGGLVEVFGDLSFVMTTEEPKVLSSFNCSKENEEAGVLNLVKRIKELETQVSKIQGRGKINMEEVMQEFLGTCVTFNNVEAGSFEEFERQQRRNSSLNKEKFQVVGTVPVSKSEPLKGVASQKIEIFDI